MIDFYIMVSGKEQGELEIWRKGWQTGRPVEIFHE